MASLEVRSSDGLYFVRHRGGQELLVHEAGTPIRPLLPGWHVKDVLDNLAPIHLLNLRHENGAEVTWVLDDSMQRIALGLRELAGPMRSVLQQSVVRLLSQAVGSVLAPPVPQPQNVLAGLETLCDAALHPVVDMGVDAIVGETTLVNLSPLLATLAKGEDPGPIAGLRISDLAETLSGSIPQDCVARMATGEMRCVAPDGVGSAIAQIGMILLDRLTAYRYVSKELGAFYIFTRDYHQTKCALYIPSLFLYVRTDEGPDLRTMLGVMLVHVVRHHARFTRCLVSPSSDRKVINFIADFPKIHIGHVIWNELSGLEELIALVPESALPDVMIINADLGSEPYGAVDVLFPEFAGKIRRPDITWHDAAAYVYDENLFFVRYMTRLVRRSVGRRILEQNATDARLDGDRRLARRLGANGQPCILLGLRVGNRTLRDQTSFLIAAIDHLTNRLGRITIVLEGSNSRLGFDPSTTFGGFRLPGSEEPVLEELRIVFAIREHYRNRPVDIVSTVGCPLISSLFWIEQSQFFVAPWGAALAKYRWVCNLPGFVVTNRHNIATPVSDLPIYHTSDFVEAPSSMLFVDLDHVHDAPGPAGFYANFDIDQDALRRGIDAMITLTGAPHADA